MTQYGIPFDGLITGDASKAPYSATEWARVWQLMFGTGTPYPNYGVFKGSGNGTYAPLEVLATNPVSTNVEVQIGAALVNGRFYENDAVASLAIGSNASGNPRIDTIVLRLDYASQTVRLVVRQGSPAVSPSRVTLQQDSTYWEIPIADIAVANGFATLAQSTISQRQRAVQGVPFGWQPYAYPAGYSSGLGYATGITLNANQAAIIPFMLSGNMLLQSVTFRYSSGIGLNAGLAWDLYFEDTNDGLTAENTLRRVAQCSGTLAVSTGGVVVNNPINALTPTPLTPGVYWLIAQNRGGPDAMSILGNAAGVFNQNLIRTKTFSASGPGQTAEVVTSVSSSTVTPGVRLNGRVFGEAAAF